MLQGEPWQGMGEYVSPKHYRQRVRARRRPEDQQAINVRTKSNTERGARGMFGWLKRLFPWFATPEGGRL
jgi:hypothetical protein